MDYSFNRLLRRKAIRDDTVIRRSVKASGPRAPGPALFEHIQPPALELAGARHRACVA
jgi:hypothetical protein